MGRMKSSRSSRGSVQQRCAFIEESMLRNLQEMREYRLGIEEVQQRRKDKQREFLESLKQKPETMKLVDLAPATTLDPANPNPKEFLSIKERISAMEANAEGNYEAMDQHRTVLNSILAVRKEAEAQAAGHAAPGEALSAAAAAAPSQEGSAEYRPMPGQYAREVQCNAKWMGPALQKTAGSKAKVDEAKAERAAQDQTMRSPMSAVMQGSAGSAILAARQSGGEGKRPQSGFGKGADAVSRPMTATTCAPSPAWHSRPQSASRPLSAATRGTASRSRPSSANSLCARFRNIQESVDRNQEALQAGRHGIHEVVKMRQERAQKMTEELLGSIKALYEKREAERLAEEGN